MFQFLISFIKFLENWCFIDYNFWFSIIKLEINKKKIIFSGIEKYIIYELKS